MQQPSQGRVPLAAVLGPTAAGKSELALAVAERFGGEIINFDSVQIYKGFDLGSAKLPAAERRGIPHHLIDVAEPAEWFTAGDYVRLARQVLEEIRGRRALPVLTGGTGFYLRALLRGLFSGPARDEPLRRRLKRRAARKPRGYLHRLLQRLDPAAAKRIHPHDENKLIRALEVCLLAGRPVSALWGRSEQPLEGFEPLRIGLDPPRAALHERINLRSEKLFARGLADEVRRLLVQGTPRTARPFASIGYRQALDLIEGRLSEQEAVEAAAAATRQYARRQMTWFRREPGVFWLAGFGDAPQIQQRAIDWLAERLRQ